MIASRLRLPPRRNSVHPAWLLVVVVPFLRALWLPNTSDSLYAVGQLLLGLLLAVPCVLWYSGTAPAWVVQVLKEFRGQMAGVLFGALVPMLGIWYPDFAPLFTFGFPFGVLLVASGIWAGEIEHRTLISLLGQPCSRDRLYLRKMAVLGFLLLFLGAEMALTSLDLRADVAGPWLRGNGWTIGCLVLLAFVTSPWFALRTRSTIGGATFSLAVPLFLHVVLLYAQRGYHRLATGTAEPPSDEAVLLLTQVAGVTYALVFGGLGWWAFRRLEVPDGGPSSGQPLVLWGEGLSRWFRIGSVGAGPVGSLVRKELRLQSIPWVFAGLMGLLALLAGTARWLGLFAGDLDQLPSVVVVFLGLGAFGCLLGAGAACVAEERQLGTHDGQLTLPATLGRQWRVKLLTTLAVGLATGLAWPLVLVRLALGEGVFGEIFPLAQPWALLAYPASALGVLAVAIHASSLCRTTLKAGVATLGGLLGFFFLPLLIVEQATAFNPDDFSSLRPGSPLPWAPTPVQLAWILGLLVAVGWVALVTVLLAMARRNHRCSWVSSATCWRQGWILVGVAVLVLLLPAGALGEFVARNHRNNVVESLADQMRDEIPDGATPREAERIAAAIRALQAEGTQAFQRYHSNARRNRAAEAQGPTSTNRAGLGPRR